MFWCFLDWCLIELHIVIYIYCVVKYFYFLMPIYIKCIYSNCVGSRLTVSRHSCQQLWCILKICVWSLLLVLQWCELSWMMSIMIYIYIWIVMNNCEMLSGFVELFWTVMNGFDMIPLDISMWLANRVTASMVSGPCRREFQWTVVSVSVWECNVIVVDVM